jgi:hypothetical protein
MDPQEVALVTWESEIAEMHQRHRPVKAREAEAILVETARLHGMTPTLLLSPCKVPRVVAARRSAAHALMAKGLTMRDTAIVLGMHRSSVGYLVGRYTKEAA